MWKIRNVGKNDRLEYFLCWAFSLFFLLEKHDMINVHIHSDGGSTITSKCGKISVCVCKEKHKLDKDMLDVIRWVFYSLFQFSTMTHLHTHRALHLNSRFINSKSWARTAMCFQNCFMHKLNDFALLFKYSYFDWYKRSSMKKISFFSLFYSQIHSR